ncbi:hypothetical protein K1T71_000831 [Dendrolimus kikuchii]|uniref:Uncharacterized protein n=1 Tax=Dendrolimus kikuchii TaxID=765133 RepID=A0ACC1DKT6_9NEOP|nr:hypothetical protein K1T71_000831 [Dendrolimus kikuchii]
MELEEIAKLADQINDIVPVNSQVTCASTSLHLATGSSTSMSTGSPVEVLSRQIEVITQRLETMEREKWFSDRGTPIREGIIAVMCNENLSPLHWRLARIHAVHPDTYGIIRVA